MHTSLVRIQNLFGFFTTVSFVVGLMIALSSVVLQKEVENVSINVKNVQVVKGRQHQYYTSKPTELAFVKFDLEADLTPLFNWNTKQIFAYLTASYPAAPTGPGSKYVTNDVVIWDIIILSKDKAKLKLRNQRAKYNVNDITNKWREQNATLAFGWNIQPHVGALTWKEKGVGQFKFPALKAKGGKGK